MPHNSFSDADLVFMRHALKLAENGVFTTAPNPAVGCVLVKEGRVVAEGWHEVAGGPHAEIVALKKAGDAARGTTAYVTLEPCSHHGKTGPCCDALIAAGVARVVCAMSDPNPLVSGKGLQKLIDAGIACTTGVLQTEAEQLNRGFFKRMRTGLPFVTVKVATSLDGAVALKNGVSQWITGDAARHDVQWLRARQQAILTGAGTARADNPRLTVRLTDDDWKGGKPANYLPPMRVLLDGRASLRREMHLCDGSVPTLVFHTAPRPESWPAQVISKTATAWSLRAVLEALASQGCNNVLIEAGPCLSGAALNEGLADELVSYIAPKVLGNEAKSAFKLPEFSQIGDCPRFVLADCRQIGEDLRLTFTPAA